MNALSLPASIPLQMHSTLAGRRIRRAKTPVTLGECIVDEGMPIVGVHPFFRETSDTRIPAHGIQYYVRYRQNMLGMFRTFTPDTWARTVLFVESQDALRATADILKSEKINAQGVTYFLSCSGEIECTAFGREAWSEALGFDDIYFEMRKMHNANDPAFGKLKQAIGYERIFVFGLYANACMRTAVLELKSFAENAGRTVEVALNSIATLRKDKTGIFPSDATYLRKIERENA